MTRAAGEGLAAAEPAVPRDVVGVATCRCAHGCDVGADRRACALDPVADRERRRTGEAHEQHRGVPGEPEADRVAVGDPERREQQHEHSLTDAEARERDRDDLGHRDHGDERDQRGERHAGAEGEDEEADGRDRPRSGTRTRCRARRPRAGGRRAGATMPSWTAPMNRVQFSLPSNRPAAFGWPARKRMVPSAASAMPETSSATQAVLDSSSDGSIAKPMRHSAGSARKPVSRSSATAANAVSVVPMSLAAAADPHDVAADGRRQHVADELPGEVVGAEPAGSGRARRTRRSPSATATPRARCRAWRCASARASHDEGPEVAVARRHLVEVDLADQERQQHRADDDPQRQHRAAPGGSGRARPRRRAPA